MLPESNHNKMWAKLTPTMNAIIKLDSPVDDPEAAKGNSQVAFSKSKQATVSNCGSYFVVRAFARYGLV